MKPLTARDTLTDRLSRVSARAHPCQTRHGAGTVYAVFDGAQDDPDGHFIGLVTPQDIAHFPDRIFADLVRGWTGRTVDAGCGLDEVDHCFTEHDLDVLAITEHGRFLGAITRESLFQALLDRERNLMLRTRALQRELETDRSRLSRWSGQLRALHEISYRLLDMISHVDDKHVLMQSAIESLTDLIGARYGALAVIGEDGQMIRFLQTGIDDETARRIGKLPAGNGLLGQVLAVQQVLRIDDLPSDPRFEGFPPHHPPMHKLLAAPIIYHGHTLGRVYLCDKATDSAFNDHDELLTVIFANTLASILATSEEQTRRQAAEQQAGKLLMENRQLSRHLLNATEEERRYLARELHDEMGQCTTAIQAEAETIAALSSDLDPRIHQCASSISDLGARLYSVVHAMLRRLRPELLDDLGLSEAIRHIVRTWQSQHPDIDCRLHLGRRLDEVDEAAAIVVYRVVQECLTNVSRHSRATAMTLRLAHRHNIDGSRFHVLVRDNGNGWAPKQEGLGLIGLRERVESLGGELRIEWNARGMRLLAQIPTD